MSATTQDPSVPVDVAAESEPLARAIGSSLWRGLTAGLLLLVLAVAVATIVVPKVAGAVPLTVLSNSMAPAMPVGSLSVVQPTMGTQADVDVLGTEQIREINDVSGILVGDVITYQPESSDEGLISHRVTGVTVNADGSRTFTTQGDNNGTADEPVQDFQVRGVVWYHVPLLGYVNEAVNGEHRTLFVVGIAAAGYAWAISLWSRNFRRPATRWRPAA